MNRLASFDRTKIAYAAEGEGSAVLLLHDFGMSGLDNFGPFDWLLPKLARTHALLRALLGAAPPLPTPPAPGRPVSKRQWRIRPATLPNL